MSGRNKFGFAPLEAAPEVKSRSRTPGPMGAAVREAAESLAESTEAKIEQRRRNAEDAKLWRTAEAEGRLMVTLPLSEIETTDLPRDRIDLAGVAASHEMEELKSSIRARGQKEPVAVYVDDRGRYQLKQGWRRLTALTQLFEATGDARFSTVIARIEPRADGAAPSRVARYIDMVEENVIREDLTFAEMAQVAITAAADPMVEGDDADALVGHLYGSLHKMKRSYIRSFVYLLEALDGALPFPKAVSRNVGVDLARVLKAEPERTAGLRRMLANAVSPESQGNIIAMFMADARPAAEDAPSAAPEAAPPRPRETSPAPVAGTVDSPVAASGSGEGRRVSIGSLHVTVRKGECLISSDRDFSEIPQKDLERALRRFAETLAILG